MAGNLDHCERADGSAQECDFELTKWGRLAHINDVIVGKKKAPKARASGASILTGCEVRENPGRD
jgi:hypothetical protein